MALAGRPNLNGEKTAADPLRRRVAWHDMNRFHSIARMLAAAALLCGVAAMAGAGASTAQGAGDDKAPLTDQSLGHQVYMAYCAPCHGLTGEGDGPDADGFAQPPTIFTEGKYAFRSTVGDVPAQGDLERSIRVGMSGTEMVPFAAVLNERSIAAVARYIRDLSPDLADPDAKADEDDVVKVPAKRPFPRTARTIADGKKLWEDQGCGDCHLEDGSGSKDETDDWERPVFMVSFKAGYYKGGPADSDLYRSIATGMKGTTMDGYRDEVDGPADIWKLVDYIRSLDQSGDRGLIGSILGVKPSGFDYSNY